MAQKRIKFLLNKQKYIFIESIKINIHDHFFLFIREQKNVVTQKVSQYGKEKNKEVSRFVRMDR